MGCQRPRSGLGGRSACRGGATRPIRESASREHGRASGRHRTAGSRVRRIHAPCRFCTVCDQLGPDRRLPQKADDATVSCPTIDKARRGAAKLQWGLVRLGRPAADCAPLLNETLGAIWRADVILGLAEADAEVKPRHPSLRPARCGVRQARRRECIAPVSAHRVRSHDDEIAVSPRTEMSPHPVDSRGGLIDQQLSPRCSRWIPARPVTHASSIDQPVGSFVPGRPPS